MQIQAVRSPFVTTLAWIFIVLTGFTTFVAIEQTVEIAFVFPAEWQAAEDQIQAARDRIRAAGQSAANTPAMSQMARFMMKNVKWLSLAFVLVSALMFGASIALLKRKNWARVVFVGFLVFGVAWFVFGVASQYIGLSSISAVQHDIRADFGSHLALAAKVSFGFTVALAIGICVLFVWLIRRLTSPEVIREFASTPVSA